MMENLKLTKKNQFAKHDKDGKDRNYVLYFLNGVQLLKQKIPFDKNYDYGYQARTLIHKEYIQNGRIYQTRTRDGVSRKVSFPLSKIRLKELGVTNDIIIHLWAK